MNANTENKRCENWGGAKWAGMCLKPATCRVVLNDRPTYMCARCSNTYDLEVRPL